jgi:hypothetical protein
MITNFQKFITEETSVQVGTPLRKYFSKNSLQHENMLGKKVVTKDGEVWYINKVDPIHDNTKLPHQMFCGKRQGSEFGCYINTDNLYVPDDIDFKIAQSQIQESFDPQEVITQIGGNKALYMLGIKSGSHQLISDIKNNLLIIKPKVKNIHGINHIEIKLNSLDLYDVKFSRIRKVNVGLDFDKLPFKETIVKEIENVYFDDLPELIGNTMKIHLKVF